MDSTRDVRLRLRYAWLRRDKSVFALALLGLRRDKQEARRETFSENSWQWTENNACYSRLVTKDFQKS